MRPSVRWILAAAACGAVATSGARLDVPVSAQTGQRPTFRSGVELVSIDAAVVDGEGRPVAGLTSDSFEVLVDGKPRRVVTAQFVDLSGSTPRLDTPRERADRSAYSTNETDPAHPLPPPDRFVVLAVDHSSFAAGAGRRTLEAARRFLARLDPSDRVALATYPDPGVFVPPTTDHAAISRELGLIGGSGERIEPAHLELSIGLSEALEIAGGDRSTFERVAARECVTAGTPADQEMCRAYIDLDAPQMAAQLRGQTARSLRGLTALLDSLKTLSGRKTLVLVSAGLVSAGERSEAENLGEIRGASGAAADAETVIYALHVDTAVIDAYGADRRRVQASVVRDAQLMSTGLDLLVGLNGGAMFRVTASADAALTRIAREISAHYVLGIEPSDADRDGKAHTIRVRVAGRDATVRHRQRFTIARPSAAVVPPDEALATILRSGRTIRDLPLRVATQVMRDLRSNNVRVLVRADIGHDVATPAHLRVGLAFFDEAGQPTGSTTSLRQLEPTPGPEAAWAYQEMITLRPGTYTLRVAARDADGRVGSVVHRVEATLASGDGVRLSDLLVIDPDRAGQGQFSPIVGARVHGSRLNAFVEVYPERGAPVSAVTFALAGRDGGDAVRTASGDVAARPQEQRVVARAELDLQGLAPGDYVVTGTVYSGASAVGRVTRPVTLVDAAAPGTAGPPGPAVPGAAARPARFTRASVLGAETLAYFVTRLRAADASGPAAAAAVAADAAARGEFDVVSRSLADAPSSLSSAFLRGLALFAKGDVEPAAIQLREALRLAPAFGPAAFYLGACDAASGRDEAAVAAWQTTLVSSPDAPMVFEALADAWLRLGDGEQAMAVLLKARERWPDAEVFVSRTAAAAALMKKQGRYSTDDPAPR